MDRNQFDALLLAHLEQVLRFSIRLTGDPAVGEDLAQEAVARAMRAWESYRGDSAFGTWLLRIALNVFRDGLRRPMRLGGLPDDPPAAAAASPPARLEGLELQEHVAQLVSSLPARQREVLVLVTYEQLSPADAAAVLGISEQNLRTTLHHARSRLKAQLAEYLDQPSRR